MWSEEKAIDYVINENPDVLKSHKSMCQSLPKLTGVPVEFRNRTVCDAAMAVNYMSYPYIPDNVKTVEMTDAFLAGYDGLYFVPERLLTDDYIISVIEKYDCSFSIPKNLMNYELCERAINVKPSSLTYLVGTKFMTKEMCELAVSKLGRMISAVPVDFMSEEMFQMALSSGDECSEVWVEKMCGLTRM